MLFYPSLCGCAALSAEQDVGERQESWTEQRLRLCAAAGTYSHNSQVLCLKDLVENTVQTCWLHHLRLLMRRKVIRLSLALRFTQGVVEGVVSSADPQHSSQGILADCSGPGATGVPIFAGKGCSWCRLCIS